MNEDRVLVVDAGSSTVKPSMLDPHDIVACTSAVECPDINPDGAISGFLRCLESIDRRVGRADSVLFTQEIDRA
ncbi:hypothetical protein ACIBSV_46335 [Embleya sp. NPDC050154]|uniref:hypothetical protein n=1 Tax=Embleya sp. NPDC050154 TaxID=3363988 RepID=UPI00378D956F